MSFYTGKDRIRAALKREHADRVPITIFFGHYPARLCGLKVREFCMNPDKSVEAQIAAYEKFQPDLFPICGDAFLEAEVLGNVIEYPEDAPGHSVKRALQNKGDLAKLKIPDPERDGRMPNLLYVAEKIRKGVKDAAVGRWMTGPWNIAVNIRGDETLLFDCADDPAYVHELMKFTTEVCKSYAVAIRKRGVGVGISEAACSLNLISPKIYREFVKPYHIQLIDYLKTQNIRPTIHICGYIDPIMEDVVETDPAFLSIDTQSSLKKLREVSKGKVGVVGKVDTNLFIYATKKEMETAVENCIEEAGKESGFILAPGCDIPFNSKVENIGNYFEAGQKYGQYKPYKGRP
jgi:uroporphyrinogen decarboxylase